MIEVEHLSKTYGKKRAVNNISFNINAGEIVGFLGRNGAGKTTTMNIMTGYISATSGTVRVDGYDVLKNPLEVKKRIGYLPEHPPLYFDMTVYDYLMFCAEIKGVIRDKRRAHIEQIAETVGVSQVMDRIVGNLSKGYKQRVGLSQALIGNPPVLILDEPTVGLDPKQIISIRKLIKDIGKKKQTIIVSSHILSEIAEVCDRVIIINNGSLVAQDKISSITQSGLPTRLIVRVLGQEKHVKKELREVYGIKSVDVIGMREADSLDYLIETNGTTDVRKGVFNTLSRMNAPILQLRSLDATLEDIFMNLTDDKEGEE
ncbi:MAG TPA: ABC transporter ATP-binding protein [Clostridia bacterium]|nr:ABC transporter ATP-binding protein [Clostridia bacterium]